MLISHYDILGVQDTDSIEKITANYRKLSLIWHPDHSNNWAFSEAEKQTAAEVCQRLNAAYATLRDPLQRQQYDLKRQFNSFVTPEELRKENDFRKKWKALEQKSKNVDPKDQEIAKKDQQIAELQNQNQALSQALEAEKEEWARQYHNEMQKFHETMRQKDIELNLQREITRQLHEQLYQVNTQLAAERTEAAKTASELNELKSNLFDLGRRFNFMPSAQQTESSSSSTFFKPEKQSNIHLYTDPVTICWSIEIGNSYARHYLRIQLRFPVEQPNNFVNFCNSLPESIQSGISASEEYFRFLNNAEDIRGVSTRLVEIKIKDSYSAAQEVVELLTKYLKFTNVQHEYFTMKAGRFMSPCTLNAYPEEIRSRCVELMQHFQAMDVENSFTR